MKRIWIERLTAIFSSLLFTFFILELFIRVAYTALPVSLQVLLRDVQRAPWTAERILPESIWYDHNAYQLVPKPNVDNEFHYPDPRVGFHVSTKNWLDPNSNVGFRVPNIDWEPTWPIDAIVVGDSFTFCYVEYDDCWVRQLETEHGLNMVNLGLVATGSASKANVLNTFGLPYQPKFVIWQWYGNDFNDDYGMLSKYGELAPEETADSTPVSELESQPVSEWLHRNSAVYHFAATILSRSLNGQDLEKYTRFIDPYFATTDDFSFSYGQPYILESFDLDLERNQIGRDQTFQIVADVNIRLQTEPNTPPLVIVLIPTKEEVYAQWTADQLGDSLATLQEGRAAMLQFCTEQAILCFDSTDVLTVAAKSGQQLYYTNDSHINAAGNQILSTAVHQFLQENSLIPTP